ncbi:hypothetical protein V7S43_013308 [Phytophthora oleae]|uniref:PiggyBac transposable element-derived protein domain-containing protein n=1 Tax=Phytophthora oleae TaxID=2107226 RepID=A0ABD3F409_9STRA
MRSDDLNKFFFERYNARCVHARQTRRSPQAVSTQRDRMFYFARFVAAFDSKEVAQGRPSWFELSVKQQQEVEISNEWRRQAAMFSPETLSTFKRIILPQAGVFKGKKGTKWSLKCKIMTSPATGKQQQVVSRVRGQPSW